MTSLIEFLNYKKDKLSYSQLGQDLLVQFLLEEKTEGYFVEFGATNGIELSNTYLLEKKYAWNGILCEPMKSFQNDLFFNRSSNIDFNCVHTETGKTVNFYQVGMSGLSTIEEYAYNDKHSEIRQNHTEYTVNTITLKDLLDKYSSPEYIDYLSIDTEGSEFDILNAYDFSRIFGIITVEHNYNNLRSPIELLLTSKGYEKVFPEISDFDDWYVHKDLNV